MSFLDLTEDKESEFAPIPAGHYNVVCDSAEVKDTRSGNGQYINAKFTIMEGDQMNKNLFTMYNIKNENPKAVEIGRGQLKSMMRAAGREDFSLSSVNELEGLKVRVTTKIQKSEEYGDKAVISYYKKLEMSEESSSASPVVSDDIPF